MKRKGVFRLDDLPYDVSLHICELSVLNKLKRCQKKHALQIVNLYMTCKMYNTLIKEICNNWHNLDLPMKGSNLIRKHNFFSFIHMSTSSCMICKKLCKCCPTRDRFNLLCHDSCIDTITETTYYFNHQKLHLTSFQQRLSLPLKLIICYFKLTPEIVESVLPTIFRTGLNHDYHKICVRCDPELLDPQETLYGYYNITEPLLKTMYDNYKIWFVWACHRYKIKLQYY